MAQPGPTKTRRRTKRKRDAGSDEAPAEERLPTVGHRTVPEAECIAKRAARRRQPTSPYRRQAGNAKRAREEGPARRAHEGGYR